MLLFFGAALRAADDLPPGALTARLSSGGFALRFAGTEWIEPGDPPDQVGSRSLASPTPVPADEKIGVNLRLGEDPASLPANRRAQAEPHLARSVADTNLLVAAFQEGRYADGGAVDCGYAISRDGGQTWNRGLIPHLVASVDGGPFDRASDPVAGVDFAGTIYLNTLAIRETTLGLLTAVVLSKSTDGGQTFLRPLTVVTSATTAVFPDKNWMAINTFPGTATEARIVVTYTSFETTGERLDTPVKATASDDGGLTWTRAVTLSPPDCQGSQPMFLPDGSLAVVYWNFNGPAGPRIELARSADGGLTFGAPHPVADVDPYDDPVARDATFLPSATADRVHGVVYVTYQAAQDPQQPRILFTRSRDQGVTWTAPVPVNDTPNNRSVFNPAIAVTADGQHVSILYCDKRHDDGSGRWVNMYLAESFNGGETWEANVRVSEIASDLNLAPLTPSGRMLGDYHGIVSSLGFGAPGVGVWVDTRTGNPDPFVATIGRTAGSSFDAWRRMAFSAIELADPARGGPDADVEEDGLPNLIEYALGLSPRERNRNPFEAGFGPPFVVSFEPMNAVGDVEWVWRGSTELSAWALIEPASATEGPASDPLRLRLRFAFEVDGPQHYLVPGAREIEHAP